MRTKRMIALVASPVALAGCAVGPDYVAPLPEAPGQTEFMGSANSAYTLEEPPAQWWKLFNAPVLDDLVEQALAANTDLRVAEANLRQARAVLSESRSDLLPSTSLEASGNYGRTSGASLFMDGPGPEGETYDVGAEVGYQLDLFGKIRRGIEAGRANVGAAQAAYDLARITVVAETARAYADACTAGQQIAVAKESLSLQEQTFDLTRRRVEGGRDTRMELSQARAQLEQTRADIPTLEGERKAALFRLAVLTGKPPAEFPLEVAECTIPPAVKTIIPVGDGASLLARRPDVRAAERELAGATARIGVATADLFPSVSLGGSIGSTAMGTDELFTDKSFRFGIGPLISWSFPNIAAARARIKQAEAGADAALASFDGAWLNALQESESALARYAAQQDRVAALTNASAEAGEAARIARLRYEAGAENFQTVLDAERSLAQADALLAVAHGELSGRTVALFLALGGGWETAEDS